MTPPATLKRTRRVDNPFDARMELRLYSTEKDKLLREAEKRGMTGSDLIRSQLGELIAAEPPKRKPSGPVKPKEAPTPDPAPEAPEAAHQDLIPLLTDRLGLTTGQVILKVKLGKVQVAGNPWPHFEIPEERIADLTVDGEPLGPAE